MLHPREVPTSLNDDRKPIRLSITDPNPYHIPIAASLVSGFMLYASLPDFSTSFEEMSQDIPLLFVATSAVIVCLYFLQWSHADNQAAQDREVPDHPCSPAQRPRPSGRGGEPVSRGHTLAVIDDYDKTPLDL